MFLPHTDSFLLIQKTVVRPHFPVFLPYADSFVLKRKSVFTPGVVPQTGNATNTISQPVESTNSRQPGVNDEKKRNFLKIAGVAGAGLVASQILSPHKASALVMGSSPTTGVVGIKNAANARINPATEETLNEVLKTSDLTFDAGSLQVKVTSLPTGGSSFSDSSNVDKKGLVDDDRHVQVDVLSSALPTAASTETTLQTISFGGYKFTLRLDTVGSIDYVGEAAIGTATSAAAWRIKKVDSTTGIVLQWAGTGVFDQVWDNRTSLTYS